MKKFGKKLLILSPAIVLGLFIAFFICYCLFNYHLYSFFLAYILLFAPLILLLCPILMPSIINAQLYSDDAKQQLPSPSRNRKDFVLFNLVGVSIFLIAVTFIGSFYIRNTSLFNLYWLLPLAAVLILFIVSVLIIAQDIRKISQKSNDQEPPNNKTKKAAQGDMFMKNFWKTLLFLSPAIVSGGYILITAVSLFFRFSTNDIFQIAFILGFTLLIWCPILIPSIINSRLFFGAKEAQLPALLRCRKILILINIIGIAMYLVAATPIGAIYIVFTKYTSNSYIPQLICAHILAIGIAILYIASTVFITRDFGKTINNLKAEQTKAAL